MSSDFPCPLNGMKDRLPGSSSSSATRNPPVIPHFVESVKERWIVRQDDRTAEVRLQFMKRQLEQLKLAKDCQQTIDDLQLLSLEKVKRIKSLELETHELDLKKKGSVPQRRAYLS